MHASPLKGRLRKFFFSHPILSLLCGNGKAYAPLPNSARRRMTDRMGRDDIRACGRTNGPLQIFFSLFFFGPEAELRLPRFPVK